MSLLKKKIERIECPYEKSITILGNKWSLMIIKELFLNRKPLRFNQLRKLLKPISSKTLSLKLKDLVKYGVINRTVYPEVPIKVEYSLTEMGNELNNILESMALWSLKWLK